MVNPLAWKYDYYLRLPVPKSSVKGLEYSTSTQFNSVFESNGNPIVSQIYANEDFSGKFTVVFPGKLSIRLIDQYLFLPWVSRLIWFNPLPIQILDPHCLWPPLIPFWKTIIWGSLYLVPQTGCRRYITRPAKRPSKLNRTSTITMPARVQKFQRYLTTREQQRIYTSQWSVHFQVRQVTCEIVTIM